jgi:hypothetical protein
LQTSSGQASVLATMDDILDQDQDEQKSGKGVLKRPSSGNKRFDRHDEEGDDRTGENRDPQKACKHNLTG